MHDGGIKVCPSGAQDVIEKSQGVEHGRLNVCNEWGPGKDIRIPEWNRPSGPQFLIDEFFPGIELKSEIRTVDGLRRINNITEKNNNRKEENGRNNGFGELHLFHFLVPRADSLFERSTDKKADFNPLNSNMGIRSVILK